MHPHHGGGHGFGFGRRRGQGVAAERSASLHEELPAEVAALVEQHGVTPRLSVAADVGPGGRYARVWLVADPERVLVIGPNGAGPEVTHDVPLAELRAVRVDGLVGSQSLVVERGDDDLELVRYTNAQAKRFAKVRKRLDDWRQGEVKDGEEDADDGDRTCSRCKRPYPADSHVCPVCVNRRHALRRLGAYLRPHLGKVASVSLLIVVGSFLQLLQPQISGLFFDRVLAPTSDPTRQAGRWVAWMFTTGDRRTLLYQMIAVMLVMQIVGVQLRVMQGRISAWLAYWVIHDVRAELYAHLQTLTVRYFDKRQTGAVMSRVTQDTRAMQGFLVDGSQMMLDSLLKLVAVVLILLYENWRLTLFTVLPSPFMLALATAAFRRMRILYGRLWQRWELLTAVLQDSLGGVRVVKAFAGEPREIERVNRRSSDLADAGTAANQMRATVFPWLMFTIEFGTIVVWFYGGLQVIGQHMTTGQVLQFLTYLFLFYGPMQWISQLFNWFNETMAAAERVWEVLDEKPDVREAETPVVLDHVAGRFVFEHVTFGYEAHEPVLKDVCLEVEPGEMIGLVGHSGAGKSTLINLVCRFYDVDEGRIMLDGHDIRDIAQRDYRQNIGVVLQDSYLFNGTVFQNISYGRPEAAIEEVLAAAKAANAHDFITQFADGYDTVVGERGHRLSGGERQRISIARAILHNPRVLILDEATASVDTETERQIQDALRRLVKGRTTFAIAHRLSTLRHADRLVVIDKGRIAEMGTHDELMNKTGGTFRRLVDMQTEMNRIHYVGG